MISDLILSVKFLCIPISTGADWTDVLKARQFVQKSKYLFFIWIYLIKIFIIFHFSQT